jgi:hypothetical protein
MRMKTVEDKLKEILGDNFKLYKSLTSVFIGKLVDNGTGLKNCKYFDNLEEAFNYLSFNATPEDFN